MKIAYKLFGASKTTLNKYLSTKQQHKKHDLTIDYIDYTLLATTRATVNFTLVVINHYFCNGFPRQTQEMTVWS